MLCLLYRMFYVECSLCRERVVTCCYIHTTVDDIKTIVSQLNNSAAGHDELPPSIMKQLCNEYCIPLSYIINSPIVQGDFPEELKLAKVLWNWNL